MSEMGCMLALAFHAKELAGRTDPDMRAFFVTHMVDALGQAIVLRRPSGSPSTELGQS
jgi:hypothetical protein